MAKFKKGDRVRGISADVEGYELEVTDVQGDQLSLIVTKKATTGHRKWEIGKIPPISSWSDHLELITDYQPITPKVGERYRVLKKHLPYHWMSVGDIEEISEVDTEDESVCTKNGLLKSGKGDITSYLTTEYLELVEEELPVNKHVDVPKEFFDTLDIEVKTMGTPFRLTQMMKEMEEYTYRNATELNKTKQTTMQKLTSALKRVLSADKQTLYKAGVIGSDLELTTRGQSNYTDALFNNEGDHKKAVAEMVAMAQAELDEA